MFRIRFEASTSPRICSMRVQSISGRHSTGLEVGAVLQAILCRSPDAPEALVPLLKRKPTASSELVPRASNWVQF